MTKRVCWVTDAQFFPFASLSIASFLRHNQGWHLTVYDIGMDRQQRSTLASYAEIIPYPRDFEPTGYYSPGSKARICMLTNIPEGELLLYLDSDSIVFSSVDPIVQEFLASNHTVGMTMEDYHTAWPSHPIAAAWFDESLPRRAFPGYERWKNNRVLNAGVILASPAVVPAAIKALELYESLKPGLRLQEQTLLNSVFFEEQLSIHYLPYWQHCMADERYVDHPPGELYDQTPSCDEQRIIVRHFCGPGNQAVLQACFGRLAKKYPLPQ